MLTVVIVCNVLKTACLVTTACSRNFDPLATIGDAVASFLEHPANATIDAGPLSTMDVRNSNEVVSGEESSRPFKLVTRRWARAVSVKRWLLCMFL